MDNRLPYRELTPHEINEIRKLVVSSCANYDKTYGCLPLECECYMLHKVWTGALCRYFQYAVLPLCVELQYSLLGLNKQKHLKKCMVCGTGFMPQKSHVCCSERCRKKWRRIQNKKYQQKYRERQMKRKHLR